MRLLSVLKNSFSLLRKRPKLFVPNLVSAFVYTFLWLALIFTVASSLHQTFFSPTQAISPKEAETTLQSLSILLLFIPLVAAIDLVTYGMYPSMVHDFKKGGKISLLNSLKKSVKSWKILLFLGVIIGIFMFFISLVFGFFTILSVISGNTLVFYLAIPLTLVLILGLVTALFFLIPIGVIEEKGVRDSFSQSLSLSRVNYKEVSIVSFISLVLALLGVLAGGYFDISQATSGVSITFVFGFVFLKVIQSMIYTYISTINPYFYLEARSKQV